MIPAIVIGGGPAGAALATRLAHAGREVLVLEREAGPAEKVCGEFLSNEACQYLGALGVDLSALGAVPISRVRLCEAGRVATVPLPFTAMSLSRRVLDEALLRAAASAGATIRRATKVLGLARQGSSWSVRFDREPNVETRAVFLATGKHDLRSHRRKGGLQDDLVAFKIHWRLARRQADELDGHVELALFNGGYAGLQPIEGGRANLCLVLRRQHLWATGQRWDKLLSSLRAESPHLDARLDGAEPCWARPLALSAIPYGHIQRTASHIWRLGDQAAVIPSLSGDGMSIALHSADLAATAYLAGRTPDVYQRRLALDVSKQVFLSTALSQLFVRRAGQALLGLAARTWPSLMSTVARHTRISDSALLRTMIVSPS